MKAVLLNGYNTPLVISELSEPKVGKGEVLVRVIASGVNPLDIKIRDGLASHSKTKLPSILGIDLAGIVEDVGDSVTGFSIGDKVFGMAGGVGGIPGTLAEYVSVDAELLAKIPSCFTMKEAGALPLVFTTAWEGLVDRAKVSSGQKVLVHGGAGGVGHIAIQIARSFGAEVFTTVSEGKEGVIEKLGATAIMYQQKSVDEYVAEFTNGVGFDIVFDTIGGQVLDDSFQAVKNYTGHVVSSLGWGIHSLAPLSFRAATYSGVFTLLPLLTGWNRIHYGNILREASKLAEEGKLQISLDPGDFKLETIEQAHHLVRAKRNIGKVVINLH